jgi:predicted nucleotidyltransferase component of viral defense system
MLTSRCFTRDWIVRQMHATGARDATNLEKCILALELVSRLSAAGLNFVFKGGTCLVLHLQPIRRLSIDVDIATLEPLERVKEALAKVVARPPFTGYQHQTERDADSPPPNTSASPTHPKPGTSQTILCSWM